jgi:hypothetical protein
VKRFMLSASGTPGSASLGSVAMLGPGYRRLAARVIYQAFRDLESPGASAEHRQSARVFLTGSSLLTYWCELAEADSAVVVARAQETRGSDGVVQGLHLVDGLTGYIKEEH